jgi:hypothetical protein
VSGVDHVNATSVSQTKDFSLLSDGSIMNTEARDGSLSIDGGELHLVTNNNNGRLRLNNALDKDPAGHAGRVERAELRLLHQGPDRTDVILSSDCNRRGRRSLHHQ